MRRRQPPRRLVRASIPFATPANRGRKHSRNTDGPTASFASYWNLQVGKLTGLLHQRDLDWSEAEYQARLSDVLVRFAGGFNTTPDSGFGHPFDCIAFEITAALQFDGTMSEAEGNRWGRVALATPTSTGPAGTVRVMGSGNGM